MFLSDVEDGSSIFIDANVFVYHFSRQSIYNSSCSAFLQRIERGAIKGITSTFVVQEATHRMMMLEAAQILVGITRRDLVKYLKSHPEVVKELPAHRSIPDKISSFNLKIVSPDISAITGSQEIKKEYGLLSNDALLVYIMKDTVLADLASNDSDFERLDFIRLYRPAQNS